MLAALARRAAHQGGAARPAQGPRREPRPPRVGVGRRRRRARERGPHGPAAHPGVAARDVRPRRRQQQRRRQPWQGHPPGGADAGADRHQRAHQRGPGARRRRPGAQHRLELPPPPPRRRPRPRRRARLRRLPHPSCRTWHERVDLRGARHRRDAERHALRGGQRDRHPQGPAPRRRQRAGHGAAARPPRRRRHAPHVEAMLAAKQRIMGFGHRVYRTEDPRATILREYSRDAR